MQAAVMTTTAARIHNRRRDHPSREQARLPMGAVHKRLVLGFWALYFSIVALSNAIDLLDELGALHWKFLNSGNFDYMASIVKVYDVGAAPTKLLLAGALAVEIVAAVLFWRALASRGSLRAALQALCWTVIVWTAFIFMTELFVAYTSESPFRELLMLAIGSALVVALVPDDAGR
jgi:hypothetical protein